VDCAFFYHDRLFLYFPSLPPSLPPLGQACRTTNTEKKLSPRIQKPPPSLLLSIFFLGTTSKLFERGISQYYEDRLCNVGLSFFPAFTGIFLWLEFFRDSVLASAAQNLWDGGQVFFELFPFSFLPPPSTFSTFRSWMALFLSFEAFHTVYGGMVPVRSQINTGVRYL